MSNKDTIKLKSTLAQFEALHDRLQHTRRTSKTVTVDREALAAVLFDQSALLRFVRDFGRVYQEQ